MIPWKCLKHFKLHLLLTGAITVITLTTPAVSFSNRVGDSPQKIVSTHLCTDQLLMLLSEHERIVSLSYFSRKPGMSVMHELAQEFPINHGFAEEIIALDPDLILTSRFGNSSILLLKKLGYQVVEVPVATSLEEIQTNIAIVAKAIGEEDRGNELIKIFNSRIEEIGQIEPHFRPMLAIYNRNGFTFGKEALITQLVEIAGFRNLGAELGIINAQHLPLELLLVHQPDVLMLDSQFTSAALANELPDHPALRRKYSDVPQISMQGNLWICGTPFVADALEFLVEQRNLITGSNP